MEKELVQINIVAGVVIEMDYKYLLVQEKQPQAYGLWNLPAGRVEVGDTIEETAIKEAKEETGYSVNLLGPVGIFHEDVDRPVKHVFGAQVTDGDLQWPEDEILQAAWFSLEEIIRMTDQLRGSWVIEAIENYEKNFKNYA